MDIYQGKMDTHELKCNPRSFNAILLGLKGFEWRKKDRDFKLGDLLILKEYVPRFMPKEEERNIVWAHYTGKWIIALVEYILDGDHTPLEWGMPKEYCIMQIKLIDKGGPNDQINEPSHTTSELDDLGANAEAVHRVGEREKYGDQGGIEEAHRPRQIREELKRLLHVLRSCGDGDCIFCKRHAQKIMAEHDRLMALVYADNGETYKSLAYDLLKEVEKHSKQVGELQGENENLEQSVPWEDALWTIVLGQEAQLKELKLKAKSLDRIVANHTSCECDSAAAIRRYLARYRCDRPECETCHPEGDPLQGKR